MKQLLIVVIFYLSFPNLSSANEWEGPYEYIRYNEGFIAGTTQKGLPIYLGMTLVSTKEVDLSSIVQKGKPFVTEPASIPKDSQWITGKLRKVYRGFRYAHRGEEKYAYQFLMFNPRSPEQYRWVSAKDGEVPPGAIKLWGKKNTFVCRGVWAGAVVPGTYYDSSRTCEIAFGGRVFNLFVYEILTKKSAHN